MANEPQVDPSNADAMAWLARIPRLDWRTAGRRASEGQITIRMTPPEGLGMELFIAFVRDAYEHGVEAPSSNRPPEYARKIVERLRDEKFPRISPEPPPSWRDYIPLIGAMLFGLFIGAGIVLVLWSNFG
jgi:hypothetical protein